MISGAEHSQKSDKKQVKHVELRLPFKWGWVEIEYDIWWARPRSTVSWTSNRRANSSLRPRRNNWVLRWSQGNRRTPESKRRPFLKEERYKRWWFLIFSIFIPYLGKWSNLTNMFQRDWNHQLEWIFQSLSDFHVGVECSCQHLSNEKGPPAWHSCLGRFFGVVYTMFLLVDMDWEITGVTWESC